MATREWTAARSIERSAHARHGRDSAGGAATAHDRRRSCLSACCEAPSALYFGHGFPAPTALNGKSHRHFDTTGIAVQPSENSEIRNAIPVHLETCYTDPSNFIAVGVMLTCLSTNDLCKHIALFSKCRPI